ncbi:DUF2490 domain-containing protein [Polaribacter sp. Asnod1-A03]|uniref:DUF2490 domain-containing protein n=1 Tax=Polaribacter sp. Asnod1-A03 TaxID=3160581 RepID=UPI00386B38AF
MKRIFLFSCLCILCVKIKAQSPVETKLGSWYMFNGNHQLSEDIKLITNAHFRYYEIASEYQQEIYRLGLNYNINKKVNVTGGFVYSVTDKSYKSESPNLYEYRFYQDVNLKANWNKVKVNHRIRLAQRFKRQNLENQIKHRIRYGLFLKHTITRNLELYSFNEIFMKFEPKSFDQNRIGAGLNTKINNKLTLKTGYFYTKFSESSLHRLQIGILLYTDFTK